MLKILNINWVFFIILIFSLLISSNTYGQKDREKIDSLILQKRIFSKENKSSKVFRVQLYNGEENEAYEVQKEFRKEFPEYETTITYRQPEWKMQVGNFKTRLEADRALFIIRKKFAGAIVLEDRI